MIDHLDCIFWANKLIRNQDLTIKGEIIFHNLDVLLVYSLMYCALPNKTGEIENVPENSIIH